MIFGRKRKEETYSPEEIRLPTIEEIVKSQPPKAPSEPTKTEEKQKELKEQKKTENAKTESTERPEKTSSLELKVQPKVQVVLPKEEKETEAQKVMTAPLFVKLDRYKQILNHLAQIKTSVVLLKNNFNVLNELEKLREENLNLVREALDRLEKKILDLDSELLRPSGFREELLPHMEEITSIEATIADLKSQIEQLKVSLGNEEK